MVDQLDTAVGPVVDKRRDVAKKSDGKDVRLAFRSLFVLASQVELFPRCFERTHLLLGKLRSTDFFNGQTNVIT